MSIQVAVRVRPFNERELKLGARVCVQMDQTGKTVITDPSGGGAANKGGVREFTFDYSFWSFDGFEDDAEGVSVPDSPNSPYAD